MVLPKKFGACDPWFRTYPSRSGKLRTTFAMRPLRSGAFKENTPAPKEINCTSSVSDFRWWSSTGVPSANLPNRFVVTKLGSLTLARTCQHRAKRTHRCGDATADGAILELCRGYDNKSAGSNVNLAPPARAAPLASQILVVNPTISLFHARAKRRAGFPMQQFLDQGIVTVPAVDALRRAEIVMAFELDAGNLFSNVDELVDGNRLARTKVDGVENIRLHNQVDPFQAIVDVHEAAGLLATAPNLDVVFPLDLRLNHLAADRCWSLLAAAEPGAPGSVYVVETSHASTQAKILAKVPAHALGEQLFPAVPVFGHRRIRILFF